MEIITKATDWAMGLHLMGMFKPWQDCALGNATKSGVIKKDVTFSKIVEVSLFFDISSPFTPTFGGKKHWLLSWKTALIMHGVIFKRKVGIENCKLGFT